MCGVAGFAGLRHLSYQQREDLTVALGIGIDDRGGHAAGFVGYYGNQHQEFPRLARKLGTWAAASDRFIRRAAAAHTLMMHSRFATTGSPADIRNAHPFPIHRDNRTVLYGCHNGMLTGTLASAKVRKRQHTVDSKELFELLADREFKAIKQLEGYGVITYCYPSSADIKLCRISKQSDIILCQLEAGGFAWASTASILAEALVFASLKPGDTVPLEIGQVYNISATAVTPTRKSSLIVEDGWSRYSCGPYDLDDFRKNGESSYKRYSSSYADTGLEMTAEEEYKREFGHLPEHLAGYKPSMTDHVEKEQESFTWAGKLETGYEPEQDTGEREAWEQYFRDNHRYYTDRE